MDLKIYKKKRDFKKTAEPRAKKENSRSKKLYVIQKHAASHLHYDLRLELNGVLKSWAIPKEPSLDPHVKRLAVHVEDHPLSYGSFEGTIPKGQYGGGTVMLWDKGEWQIEGDSAEKSYKKGSLTFSLTGKKLKGLWKLVQIKKDPKNWLLIKIADKYACSKTEYDIAQKKSTMPTYVFPQLATLVDKPPYGKEWLHEIKLDGYRLICFIKENKITLMTRRNQDWTYKFPTIIKKLKKLNLPDVILDGEIVALDNKQHSNFQLLQNAINNKIKTHLFYYVFDVIYYEDHDVSDFPLIERKKLLHSFISSTTDPEVRYSDHVIGNGNLVFKKACQLSLEGIVSKSISSPYIQKRTKNWLKVKCSKRQEFIVLGFTKPQGKRQFFGSLLLGFYADNKKLTYCGHVGTGFTDASLKSMFNLLKKHITSISPLLKNPSGIKNVTWVNPEIIIEVEFSEWTEDRILRHPSFKGLRKDKSPNEVNMERPAKINLTNPDKILYPKQNITKLALATFYEGIQKWILPYIINRPLAIVRCPEGHKKECFYQKHLSKNKIKSLYSVNIKEKEKTQKYIYIKDHDGLMALIQLGVLEIHPWSCRIDNIEKPDMIIFDIDPAPDIPWKKVIQAARFIRKQLEKINLKSYVKTTGGKGLHLVVPIKRGPSWSDIKDFSRAFVNAITALKPEDFINTMSKAKRASKIYIDYLRNQRGATAIATYSTRAKENASVATPLSWDELSTRIKSDSFTINNLSKKLSQLKNDPWKDFFHTGQTLKFKEI